MAVEKRGDWRAVILAEKPHFCPPDTASEKKESSSGSANRYYSLISL